MTAAAAHVPPGTRIGGRYRVLGVLGSGGMSTVFEALDERSGAVVALKLLASAARKDAALRARFAREARVPLAIDHEGVVRVQDTGEHAGVPFLVMERLRGSDLGAALAARGPFSVGDALRTARMIAQVLRAAHAAGIVHRDLKPSNVWLVDGRPERVKVLDFGVAKWLGAQLVLTGPSQVFGTPAFMAPEQLRSTRSADPRSDLYALGATLFCMLAGHPPFVARSEVELCMMVVNDPAPDVRTLRADVPEPLALVLARALAKSPQERPASAAEMLETLDCVEQVGNAR